MTCKICGEIPTEYLPNYTICPHCEVISLHVNKYFTCKDEKHHYAQHNNTLENKGYVKMFQGFINFISLHVKEYDHVLEFGCGPGPVLGQVLTSQGKQVTCYDKYFHPDEGYKDHNYDLITSTEVFEHLDDPLSALKTLASLLKPDGHIALMTHFHPNDKERFKTWWYPKDPTHITFFTPRTFEVLANLCNLQVHTCDHQKQIILSLKNAA